MKSAGHATSRKASRTIALRLSLPTNALNGHVRDTNMAGIHTGEKKTTAITTEGAQYIVNSKNPTAKKPFDVCRWDRPEENRLIIVVLFVVGRGSGAC